MTRRGTGGWDRLRGTNIEFPFVLAAVDTMSWNQAAELNGDSCLTLSQILASFGAPISEEQGRTAPIDELHFITHYFTIT